MSITKVEFKYRKPNLRFDTDKKVWVGYKIDIRSNGKRRRDTFRTKGEAERFVDQVRVQSVYAKAGLKIDSASVPNVRQLFAARLAEIKNHSSHVRATRVFEEFRGLLEHDLPVPSVRKAHFKLYINKRTGDGVKPETINREINELAAAFNRAADLFPEELEDFEPQIARPKLKRGKRPRREITETEIEALCNTIRTQDKGREYPARKASRPAVAFMFELAWLLGLRFGEAERLLKKDYDKKKNTLRVIRWKTSTETIFSDLPGRVIEILNEASAMSTSDLIFQVACSRHTMEKIIRDACDVNGIPYGRGQADAITFHSTRHSFASRLVRVTDPATAASFTGHSSLEMLDYYSHASEDSRRRAMVALYGSTGNSKYLDIFEKVRSGKMDFEEFLAAIK